MANLARVWLALLLILLSLGVPPAAADDANLRVSILRVDTSQNPTRDLYVSVSDGRGQPITGLDPAAFSVAEDGASVPIDRVAMVTDSQVPIAFGLVMDVSGSMNDAGKLDAAKQAASGLVGSLGRADSAGVISFGDQVHVVQEFTSNADALQAAIDSLEAGGNTALYDAIVTTALLSQALPQPLKVLLVVTDGADTKSAAHLNDVLQSLTSAHALVYAIGIGSDADRPVLDQIAQAGGGQALYTDDPSTLGPTFQSILNQLRLAYLLRYRVPQANSDQTHTVTTSVSYQGQVAQASNTFRPAANAVAVDLGGVTPGETVSGDRQIRATVSSGTAQRIDLLVDGLTQASAAGQPSSLATDLVGLAPGNHDVAVRVTNALGGVTEQHVGFSVAGPPTPVPVATPASGGGSSSNTQQVVTFADSWPWLVVAAILLLVILLALVLWRLTPLPVAAGAGASAASDDTTLELAADAAATAAPTPAADEEHPRVRIDTDGQRQEVVLGADPLSIGRDADNGIVLHDPHVSRHHARISLQDGEYWIEDLKSQNGTLLNGQAGIDRRRLQPGDQLTIGGATLTYLAGSTAAESETDRANGATAREPVGMAS